MLTQFLKSSSVQIGGRYVEAWGEKGVGDGGHFAKSHHSEGRAGRSLKYRICEFSL